MPSHKRFEIVQDDKMIAQGVCYGYPCDGVSISFPEKGVRSYQTWEEFEQEYLQFKDLYGDLELDFLDDDHLQAPEQDAQTVA